jgi:hypothetical protein
MTTALTRSEAGKTRLLTFAVRVSRHQDRMAESKTTTNHDEIRRWVEERGGQPAHVVGTGDEGDPGLLRIEFPGGPGDDSNLEPISWEEFFDAFEENDLAFLYQEETKDGSVSRFSKFVRRNGE